MKLLGNFDLHQEVDDEIDKQASVEEVDEVEEEESEETEDTAEVD